VKITIFLNQINDDFGHWGGWGVRPTPDIRFIYLTFLGCILMAQRLEGGRKEL
jgi:hypothetical protein